MSVVLKQEVSSDFHSWHLSFSHQSRRSFTAGPHLLVRSFKHTSINTHTDVFLPVRSAGGSLLNLLLYWKSRRVLSKSNWLWYLHSIKRQTGLVFLRRCGVIYKKAVMFMLCQIYHITQSDICSICCRAFPFPSNRQLAARGKTFLFWYNK